MATKICLVCKKQKPLSEFMLKKNGKYHSWCNSCRLEYNKIWRRNNAEHIAVYKEKTKEHRKKKDAEYRESHRKELRLVSAIYNEKLREKRKRDRENPEYKSHRKEYEKKWREENREHTHVYFKEYYEKDIVKKILRNLRGKVRKLLKGEISPIHANNLVGCSADFFRAHIESQFTNGMSWLNYGFGADKWNIHHTPPLASYDYSIEENFREAFHWSHCSPKWTLENISENSNYNGVRYYYKK